MLRVVFLVSVVLKNVYATLCVLGETLGVLCGKTTLQGNIRENLLTRPATPS